MQLKQTLSAAGVVALVAGAFSATPATAQAETFIKVDGSSTVFPITEAVAEEFQKAKKNVVKPVVINIGDPEGVRADVAAVLAIDRKGLRRRGAPLLRASSRRLRARGWRSRGR